MLLLGPALQVRRVLVGLQVRAYRNKGEFLILAATRTEYLPTLDVVRTFYLQPAVTRLGEKFASLLVDRSVNVEKTWDSSQFKPIRDDQPFLAGNVQHIFSLQQVGILFALVLGLLLGFSGLLYLLLKDRGNPGIPGRSFPQLILISLFVGANFLIIEHYLISCCSPCGPSRKARGASMTGCIRIGCSGRRCSSGAPTA